MSIKDFYYGKKVLVTGHTGFKGAWMCCVLKHLGADVTGYALNPPTEPSLFAISKAEEKIRSVYGDVRDLEHLNQTFGRIRPEIVIHMAAQPLVREAYREPVDTYSTNVLGTVHVLECVRQNSCVKSFVNVTTDKVYKNREWIWGYREDEELNGYDPYSNSKSCSELITECYKNSYFQNARAAISTVRAGNVIGGGDFARDRIIPDCVRAAVGSRVISVRNPYSVRPYQHVLEPVSAYLNLAKAQYMDRSAAGCYNIGPDERDCCTTKDLVELFCKKWKEHFSSDIKWVNEYDGGPHEANYLKLDCSKMKSRFKWRPVWDIEEAVDRVIQWNQAYIEGGDVLSCMEGQICDYMKSLVECKESYADL